MSTNQKCTNDRFHSQWETRTPHAAHILQEKDALDDRRSIMWQKCECEHTLVHQPISLNALYDKRCQTNKICLMIVHVLVLMFVMIFLLAFWQESLLLRLQKKIPFVWVCVHFRNALSVLNIFYISRYSFQTQHLNIKMNKHKYTTCSNIYSIHFIS